MAILNTSKLDQSEKKMVPVTSKEYPTKAKRPRNSCLSNDKIQKAFVLKFKDWNSVFLESLKNIDE